MSKGNVQEGFDSADEGNDGAPLLGRGEDQTTTKKKFWTKKKKIMGAACCLCFIVSLCVLIPVGLKVIAPAMAANIVDGASLRFTKLTINEPGTDTFLAHVEGVLSDSGPFDGKMLETDFMVSYNSKTFGKMRMPEVPVVGNQDSDLKVSSTFRVLDKAVFDQMTKDMINQDVVVWQVDATVTLEAKIGVTLTFEEIPFSKEVEIVGASGFPNVTMLVFDLNDSTPTTVFVKLAVNLHNSAIFNIDPLGHLTFNIFYQDSFMGMMVCYNSSLSMGDNILDMEGVLLPENMTIGEELFNLYLTGHDVDVVAVGADNASSIFLFNEALQGTSLSTQLLGYQESLVSGLEFLSLTLTPVDNFRVRMSADVMVGIVSPLGANSPVDIQQVSMQLVLSDGDSVLGVLTAPTVPVSNGSQPVVKVSIDGELAFSDDGTNFVTFVQNFIQRPRVTLSVVGTCNVVAGTALGILSLRGLPLSETVVLTGANNFPDMEIVFFDLPANHPDGGIQIDITADLPNPTVASVSLGDVTLDLYSGPVRLGTVRGLAQLVPGSNVLSLAGNILPAPEDLEAVSAFFSAHLNGESAEVVARGVDAGSNPVTWVQEVVKSLELETLLPGYDDSVVRALGMSTLGIDFPGGSASPSVSSDVEVTFLIPFGFPFSIWQLSVVLEIIEQGVPFLSIAVPVVPSVSDQQEGKIYFSFQGVPMEILDVAAFNTFVEEIILLPAVDMAVQGVGIATIDTAAGNLTITDLGFHDIVRVSALNSFTTPPLEILALDAVQGLPGMLKLLIDIRLTNPSIVYGVLGDFTLDLVYKEEVVGQTLVKDLSLPLGVLMMVGTEGFLYDNGPGSYSRELLTNYLEGTDVSVVVKGVAGSSSVPYLDQGVSKLVTGTTLPGLTEVLIVEARINAVQTMLNMLNIFQNPKIAPTRLVIHNPFTVPFTITRTNFIIYRAGEDKIGEFIDNTYMVIDPKGQTTTEEQDVVLAGMSLDLAITILEALLGGALLDIRGEMDITIQDFSTTLKYNQYNIPSVAV